MPRSAASSSRSAMPASAHGFGLGHELGSPGRKRSSRRAVRTSSRPSPRRWRRNRRDSRRLRPSEGALVPVPAHRGHPARIDHSGAEHRAGLLGQRAGTDRVGPGVVADVGSRRLAGECPHRGHHARDIGNSRRSRRCRVRWCRCSWRPPRCAGIGGSCRRPPRGRPGRGRRRIRPTRCTPARGRRRLASCGCRSAAATRHRRSPAWSRESVVERRVSPCWARSACACART